METKGTRVWLLPACVCLLLLFAVFSWHRAHLIPRGADFERAAWLLTGDEPSYLLMAQAIAAGDGLDVRPAHERGSYRAFQSRAVLGPDTFTWNFYRSLGFDPWFDRSASWGNRQVMPRPPLFAAVVAPLVSPAGNPRWLVGFMQGLLVSCTAALCLWCVVPADRRAAIHGAAALLFILGSIPIAYYTTQIFPEILAGVLLLAAFALYARGGASAGAVGNLLLVLSLWTTPRVVGGVLAASVVLLVQDWRARRFAGIGALLLGWFAFLAWNLWVWGYWLLPNPNPNSRNSLLFLPEGTLRFFFGNDVGLFFLSPVLWIGLVAAVVNLRLLREHLDLAWTALFLGVLAVVASFPDVRGGTCPAGRYQVIPAFLLVFPLMRLLGSKLAEWRRRLVPLLYLLGVAGLIMSLVIATKPSFWYRRYHPLFAFEEIRRFHVLLPPGQWPALLWMSLAWLGVLLALLFLPQAISRRLGKKVTP